MSIVKDSKWRRYQSENSDSESETIGSDETSDDSHTAHLHEYARRDGPHEDSEDVNERYNISEEDELEGYENADIYHESDNDEEQSRYQHVRHPYAEDYLESESVSQEKPEKPIERTVKRKSCGRCQKPNCKSCNKPKKTVYVYKQPPIIVKPKPTNVYIKSKPIVVQPPPLVVHHPEPKPCNPIIKYRPPNIKLKPVIVKISKPKTTTTTTTPCPSTTKKPCRKCRRKPTKNCDRCSRKKSSKNSKPRVIDDFTVFLDQNRFRPEQTQFIRDGVLT